MTPIGGGVAETISFVTSKRFEQIFMKMMESNAQNIISRTRKILNPYLVICLKTMRLITQDVSEWLKIRSDTTSKR